MKNITVVGSSNIDFVAKVHHLPVAGETIGEANFVQNFGGKGANQVIAANRLGGNSIFVTALGNDIYANSLKTHFEKEGIDVTYIINDTDNSTGTAVIYVAESGENCIAVAPGANYSLQPHTIKSFEGAINKADIIVMQAEIPYQTIKEVALLAKQKEKKILFNPAPACHIDEELMSVINILVVNEVEAAFVSGLEYTGNNTAEIAEKILQQGAQNVVITLGRQGVYMKNHQCQFQLPGFKVKTVDTTAAGDTFCGALAVACANEELNYDALLFANAAAALTVTKLGAQPSIPTLDEVEKFISETD